MLLTFTVKVTKIGSLKNEAQVIFISIRFSIFALRNYMKKLKAGVTQNIQSVTESPTDKFPPIITSI